MKKIIIAIDGHSACGKSTLAKSIAKELDYIYVDTGSMYRAITYYFIKEGLIIKDDVFKSSWQEHLDKINITFNYNRDTNENNIYLNGVSAEDKIRSLEISQQVSYVSKLKAVRQKLVFFQKALGKNKEIVIEGRDIGTIVFPEAEVKLWITASTRVRAARRYKEMIEQGYSPSLEDVIDNIKQRDYEDSNRKESPLKMASDAKVIDNSILTKDETLNIAMDLINKYLTV